MSAIRKRVHPLGTVTTGTPSGTFPIGEGDDVLIQVSAPSVSMTVTLESTPDNGTTWIPEATSGASSVPFSLKVTAPTGGGLGRVTNSAGNSPMWATVTKRGGRH